MPTTGQIIKMLREERRLSQDALADILDISKSAIGMYETDKRRPKNDILEAIADYFNVDMNFLHGKTNIRNSTKELEEFPSNVIPVPKMKKVPMLGTIACGEPIFATEEFGEMADLPEGIRADFALTAQGDSMTGARIYSGDLVFCQSAEMVNNGQIAAVIIDDTATLKRFYYHKDKDLVILKAENPAYSDLIYSGDEINQIRVIGRAVAFQSLIK